MDMNQDTGRIEVITGCMFAGKTEELIRRLQRAEIADQNVRVFSPEIDDRYDKETIGSHNGKKWEASVIPINEEGRNVIGYATNVDVVAVDEFNFFDESFVPVLQSLADAGVRVIVSGLDQTFRGEPFEPMDVLLAVADDVEKLTAVCEVCGGVACRTQRLIEGDPAPADAPTVLVGGEESYEARCRSCHTVPQDTSSAEASSGVSDD